MLKIVRPSGFAITSERTRLNVVGGPAHDEYDAAEVEVVVANGEVEVIVRRIENDPTVKFTVV